MQTRATIGSFTYLPRKIISKFIWGGLTANPVAHGAPQDRPTVQGATHCSKPPAFKRLLRTAGNIDLPHNPIFQLFVTYGKLHSDYSPLQAIKTASEDWKLHSRKIHFKPRKRRSNLYHISPVGCSFKYNLLTYRTVENIP
ncbi:hypothetical protein G6L89_010500 [Agrobacterium fabrum]|uniref:hypothetical protein n=1 Tax=Agrobacterium fabrum TaxID=1176649 RepID=UPI0015740C7F|nr:hypothetical protein [Agrobacterium fabrum]NTB08258.1 hypothetical protein [Agrobacterium fabrum]